MTQNTTKIIRGIKIVDYTRAYDGRFFVHIVERGLNHVSENDLKNIECVNIYDACPTNFPFPARGSHYRPTTEHGAQLDIYLDQNLCNMISFTRNNNIRTSCFNRLFIYLFGKLFILDTLLHEIGHHVHDDLLMVENSKDSEEYANRYALEKYIEIFPTKNIFYKIINGAYHLIYRRRISHAETQRQMWSKSIAG